MRKSEKFDELIQEATVFAERKKRFASRDEQIIAANTARDFVVKVNQFYKDDPQPALMDLMKSISAIKRKIEAKIKRPLRSQDL
jgi:hypothetical protein